MCEWFSLQGPGFKLTLRHHFLPDGFLRDTTGLEHKHRNASHKNLTLWDGLASETNPPQPYHKCEAPIYNTMIYFPIFLEEKKVRLIVKVQKLHD